MSRFYPLLRSLSQVLSAINAAISWRSKAKDKFFNPENVTFSAYCHWRGEIKGYESFQRWQSIINFLFRDKDHCRNAYLAERDDFPS